MDYDFISQSFIDDGSGIFAPTGGGSSDVIVTRGADVLGTVRGLVGDLGNLFVLNKRIDAEQSRPFYFNDPAGGQYALGPGGQLFVRGQSAGAVTASTAALVTQLVLLGVLVGGAYLAFKALKG